MSLLTHSDSFEYGTYVMGLQLLEIFLLLYNAVIDYRRQILTTKVNTVGYWLTLILLS